MNNFKRFLHKETGSVIVLVAVMLVLIIAILMITIDLGRMQSGSAHNQSAIDATALAAAEYITRYRVMYHITTDPADLTAYAEKVFKQNLTADQADATIATTTDVNGNTIDNFQVTTDNASVTVNACLNVATSFAAIRREGRNQTVCSTAKASIPSAKNVEIVFALDTSPSMNFTYNVNGVPTRKIDALRDSVDSLMDSYHGTTSIYWGVVPYTGFVDLGNFAPNIVKDDLANGVDSPYLHLPGTGVAAGAHELNPGTESHGNINGPPTPLSMPYNYDTYEDPFMDNFERYFNDTTQAPGSYALEQLRRVPLTSREGNEHPEDPSTIVFDDAPPTPGNMFQAYYHQPYDFFMTFDTHEGSYTGGPLPSTCGACYSKNTDFQTQTSGAPCANPVNEPCALPVSDPRRPTDGSCDEGYGEGGGT